jgi:rod shape-determining protein MreB
MGPILRVSPDGRVTAYSLVKMLPRRSMRSSAMPQPRTTQVSGSSATSTAEIREAIEEPVAAIVDAVKVTLDKTPPELAADIMQRGIVITGGGALLHGMAERLEHETGMPIVIAPNPLHAVAIGSGQCLEEFEVLKGVFINSNPPN